MDKQGKVSEDISLYLVSKMGFTKVRKTRSQERELDWDLYTAVKRVHEAHYLFWSEDHKAFSIAYKLPTPKGLAGGGIKNFDTVMLPKVIYSIKQAKLLVTSITQ